MDDPKLIAGATSLISELLKILTSHGIEGIIGIWLVWEKWINPRLKRGREDWVSWRDVKAMKEKQIELEKRQDAHEALVNGSLLKESEKEVKLAVMGTQIVNQERELTEIKVDIKDIFRVVSEIKNMMIEKGEK